MEKKVLNTNEPMAEKTNNNTKFLNESFAEISQIEEEHGVVIDIEKLGIKNQQATIWKNGKGYCIEFYSPRPCINESNEMFDVVINTYDKKQYNGQHGSLNGFQIEGDGFRNIIKIQNIIKGIAQDELYYRMIIPIPQHITIITLHIFPVQAYTSEQSQYSEIGLIRIGIQEKKYDIFEVCNNGRKYLVIDCNDEIDCAKFREQSFAILVSLGFITAHFFQEECYIVASNQK